MDTHDTPHESNPTEFPLDALREIGDAVDESMREYSQRADEYWNTLSPEQRLMAFHAVCSRIHQGDITDQGSYRHVLYSVFGFDPGAYMIGMSCGYLEIHNAIADGLHEQTLRTQAIKDSLNRVNGKYSETLKRLAASERADLHHKEPHDHI